MGTMQRRKRIGRELAGLAPEKLLRRDRARGFTAWAAAAREVGRTFKASVSSMRMLRKAWLRFSGSQARPAPLFDAAIFSDPDSLYDP